MRYQRNVFTAVLDRAFQSRNEALTFIQNVGIELELQPGEDPRLVLAEPFSYTAVIAGHKPKSRKKIQPQWIPEHKKTYTLEDAVLFSSTGKMSAGSFGTSAGTPAVGGACQAAGIGPKYTAFKKLGDVDQKNVREGGAKFICNYCYANKGNYMHRGPQWMQAIRNVWLQRELEQKSAEEVGDVLTRAVELHSSNTDIRTARGEDPRFFRIHDSGDLFSKKDEHDNGPGIKALLAWYRVCKNLPKIRFWCPTRMWVFVYFPDFVQQYPPPTNLALRPSALHFNDKAPMVSGFSAGSTSHWWNKKVRTRAVEIGLTDIVCPAYSMGGTSCAGAFDRGVKDPELGESERGALGEMIRQVRSDPRLNELTNGGHDCRACWLFKEARVSYTAH